MPESPPLVLLRTYSSEGLPKWLSRGPHQGEVMAAFLPDAVERNLPPFPLVSESQLHALACGHSAHFNTLTRLVLVLVRPLPALGPPG